MQFDISGNLKPYDVIQTDWFTFKAEFVDAFPHSETRRLIFENFSVYMETLIAIIGTGFHQWIDGSFVTRKLNPGDIDFVTFIDSATFSRNENLLNSLRVLSRDRSLRLDGYYVKNYPMDRKEFIYTQMDSIQWRHEFAKDSRKRQSKGFIQLNY
ncbi:DUF6932 family protein [Dyadobacter fermentans]|uniref:Uncharacterized protein n=1 Tax=Dyadobacter fermentans (strain ATCC 700827 / DSM 18053 / CIP 107007 / KCTC 52180 / NS114) TaxID=471854 RepID=C6VXZ5_DYAFD|nr:hypothetical protein [Dyadobacter fermentans]ACT96896.1 hypothetical protein Dfer_5707 [Dyadobacter fermentans DSM 18053]